MRNLKKVLSLALAMVMLLGMMVVGAGATSFKDDGEIQNKEAVEVVSAIGILTGVGDNTFAPKGTLTRAEAAVVIAKLDLGAAFGNLETTNASTFKDVAAGSGYGWAKPYIDYCYARGLIAGDGNGYYFPAKEVSGVEFALMVSRVLGYEDKAEQIGGADWEVEAAALARKADLTKNVTLGSQAITRDEMAQVAYNALQADMVYYRTPATEIDLGNGSVSFGGTPAEAKGNSNGDYRQAPHPDRDTDLQLCEEKFPDLRLRPDTDDFKRQVYTWFNGKDEIGSYQMEEPTFTYTAKKTAGAVASDLSGYTVASGLKPWINGKAATAAATTANVASTIAGQSGNGVVVEIYADNNRQITNIVVVNTYLMTVRKVASDEITLVKIGGEFADLLNTVGDTSPCFATLADLKVNDYVLVTPYYEETDSKGNDVYSVGEVAVPETVTGALTRVNRNTTDKTTSAVTVAGNSYSLAKNNTAHAGELALANLTNSNLTAVTKKDATLYLDTYGYALLVKDVEASTNYIYVTSKYQALIDNRVVNMVTGITTSGETVTLNAGSPNYGSSHDVAEGNLYVYTAPSATNAAKYGCDYDFTLKGKNTGSISSRTEGVYSPADNDNITIGAGATTMIVGTAVPFANDVKFIYAAADGTSYVRDGVQAVSGTAFGGVSDTAASSKIGMSAVLDKRGTNNVVIVAVYIEGLAPSDGEGSEVLYVSEFAGYQTNDRTTAIYKAYLPGETKSTEIFVKGGNPNLAGNFYTFTTSDVDGVEVYSLGGSVYVGSGSTNRAVSDAVVTDTMSDNLIEVKGNFLRVTSETVFVDLCGSKISSVQDITEALADGQTVKVAALYNDSGTAGSAKNNISYLYIVQADKGNVSGGASGASDVNTSGANSVVTVVGGSDASGATANISGDAMATIKTEATSSSKDLDIVTPVGTVTLPSEMLTTGGKLENADAVTVTVTDTTEDFDASTVPGVEEDDVVFAFDVTVSGVSGSITGEEITYTTTIETGLTQANIKVYRVSGSTKTAVTVTSYNPTTGELVLELDHLSSFVVVNDTTTVAPDKTPAATIPSEAKTVTVGSTATVAVTKADSAAKIAATSSDTAKATVAVSGNNVVITGVAAGSATVTITVTADNTAEYTNVTQTVAVTVSAAAPATHTITVDGAKASEYTVTASAGETNAYTEGTEKVITLTANAAGAKTGYTVTVTGVSGISPVHTVIGADEVTASDAVFAAATNLTAWVTDTDYYTQSDTQSGEAVKGSDGKYYTKVDTKTVTEPASGTTYYTMTTAAKDAVAAKTDTWTITIPTTAKADITITVAAAASV